jgi:hypothetical protein
MLPTRVFRPGGQVTVAWEIYGLGSRREPLAFRLTLVKEEGGLFRRALRGLGLIGEPTALTLSWVEGGVEGFGPVFRAVDLDLPELEPGSYRLQLRMDLPYRTEALSSRRVLVR